ncbi:AAA family ATPase [Nocardia sp. NPDC051321]|uniref:AAA family ATPase n=1 Tax=Nocardia sp. NPDC051321 TaxID=3364323 RepID=UPI00378FA660
MTDDNVRNKVQRAARLAGVFTPAAPVSTLEAFTGRLNQIMQTTSAVAQPGRHVILYGERGVGKTSLANVLSDILPPQEGRSMSAVRINCAVDDSYGVLWGKVFDELRVDRPDSWRHTNPNPDDIRRMLGELQPPRVLVIDEYDRIDDDAALSLMADTIKALSDHLVKTKLVLVGVSDSIEGLIGEHESVRRALEEVQMPRMDRNEVSQLVRRGFGVAELTITSEAEHRIVRLSEGLPTYAHLLSLKSGERAIADDRDTVTLVDIEQSTKQVVSSQHSMTADYHTATHSSRPEAKYAQVLAACALAKKDPLGFFTAKSVAKPLSSILGKTVEIPHFSRHLASFLEDDRGRVLVRRGVPKNYQYRFRDPLMQPFAILAALANELVQEGFRSELFDNIEA